MKAVSNRPLGSRKGNVVGEDGLGAGASQTDAVPVRASTRSQESHSPGHPSPPPSPSRLAVRGASTGSGSGSPTLDWELPPAWDGALEELRTAMRLAGRSETTIRQYALCVERFARFLHRDGRHVSSPGDVSPAEIPAFLVRPVSPRRPRSTRPQTHTARYRAEEAALRQFYRHLFVTQGTPSPFPPEQAFRQRRPRPRVRHLTTDEVQTFLATIGADPRDLRDPFRVARDRAIFRILFLTGLRISELLSLHTIDLKNAVLARRLTVTGKGQKTRTLDLGPSHLTVLADWLRVRASCPYPGVRASDPFPTRRGPITVSAVERAAVRYADRAGLSDVTPHVFRHTFATLLADRHVPIEIIQELLGHADISTSRMYVEPNAEARKRAMLEIAPTP